MLCVNVEEEEMGKGKTTPAKDYQSLVESLCVSDTSHQDVNPQTDNGSTFTFPLLFFLGGGERILFVS